MRILTDDHTAAALNAAPHERDVQVTAIQIPPPHRDTWGRCQYEDDPEFLCDCDRPGCQRYEHEAIADALAVFGEQLAQYKKHRRTLTARRCRPDNPAEAQRWIRRYRKWHLDESLVARLIGPAWCADMTDMRDVEFTWLEFEAGIDEWRERKHHDPRECWGSRVPALPCARLCACGHTCHAHSSGDGTCLADPCGCREYRRAS